MPSDAAKRRQQQKKDSKKVALEKKKDGGKGGKVINPSSDSPKLDGATPIKLSHRSCTGVLTSHHLSRDIHLEKLSVTFHGAELLSDAKLELNCGRKYGLVGLNGSGKSTLLGAIGEREVPIPDHVDIYHLTEEMPATDSTPLQCVMEVDNERMRLEEEAEELSKMNEPNSDRLMDIYERLEELDASTAETKAARILHGLGFTHEMQHRKCRDFSGGWRMRISLAFVKPHLLLLDEPTNHLDLEACVWLEEELKRNIISS
jgi:ATP-binding cassette subfamily F protein 2